MRIIGIVEAKVWKRDDGRVASIYGASPWQSAAEKARWQMVTRGWTWECDDGTVGLGRVPAATREEAESLMERFNALGGR